MLFHMVAREDALLRFVRQNRQPFVQLDRVAADELAIEAIGDKPCEFCLANARHAVDDECPYVSLHLAIGG